MLILDAHQDIAYNQMMFGRDYTSPAWLTRRHERGSGRSAAALGLPDALLGRVGIVFATLFVAPKPNRGTIPYPTYSTPREAYEQALRQMDYYHKLADEHERIQLIQTQADLDAVLASWAEGTAINAHRQGLVILMEGADPILEPKQFDEWYERGVRIVAPAWQATRYAGGTGAPGGLSALGYELLEVLAGYHTLLDVSHLAEQAYFEVIDRYEGQIIASHSNPRKFHDTDRHLSDAMIRRLAERAGVIGVVLYNHFLKRSWRVGDAKRDVPLSRVIEVIDHICQLTGSADCVGIGSDFDGGFGAESIPYELDTVGDLYLIGRGLHERGFDSTMVDAILSGNMLRKLRETLPG